MKIQASDLGSAAFSTVQSAIDSIERDRKSSVLQADPSQNEKKVQPEEVLSKIKELTGDGRYNVQFHVDQKTHEMVIQLVDAKSGDTIRQIPPKELLELRDQLQKLGGHLVNTKS